MGPLSTGPHQWPQVACVTAALWASTHWMVPKTGACEGFCGLGPKGLGEASRGQQGRPWQVGEGEGLGDHWGADGGGACWGAWAGGSRRAPPGRARALGDAAQASEERLRCPFSSTGSHRVPRAPRDPRSPWESGTCVWGWGWSRAGPGSLLSCSLRRLPQPHWAAHPVGTPGGNHMWHTWAGTSGHTWGEGASPESACPSWEICVLCLSRHEVRCGECPSGLCDPQHCLPALPPS